jgi:DNA mismatch repair protein MutL
VRFRDGQSLYHLVLAGVRERLRAANLTSRLRIPTPPPAPAPWDPVPEQAPGWTLRAADSASRSLPLDAALPAPSSLSSAPSADGQPTPTWPVPRPEEWPPPGSLKAIQLYDAYLVLETPEGMLVIDQHALHERILFEHLQARVRQGDLETQRLLIPEPVDLTAEQSARVLEHRESLAELGLGVEDFGGGTVLLTSYPAMLGNRSPQRILRAVVDHLVAKDRMPSREQLLREVLSLMACHAAVRSGDRLTPEEIAALVAQRHLAEDPHHCPHGRPTSLLFSRHELDRQFRRV